MKQAGSVRVGVGGWTFEPWRGVFYPPGLKQADELAWASRRLTAIEINATYYSSQKPQTFARWAAQTPDGFVFSLKASRFCTNRRVLAEAGESITRFLAQGISELGDRLGPVVWQFANTKRFEPADFEAFLRLLPAAQDGLPLRHVLEARHDSFAAPEFVEMARRHGCAICLADHASYPSIPDVTADLVYVRLMTGADEVATAYPAPDLDAWAARLRTYAAGGVPPDLPTVTPGVAAPVRPRDVFAFIIHEGKVRAPAGAMGLIERLQD